MSTISKVFTVLNLVFSLVVVGSVASILSKGEDYRAALEKEKVAHTEESAKLQGEIATLKADATKSSETNRVLTSRNSDLTAANSRLEESSKILQAKNDALDGSVEANKNELKKLNDSLQVALKDVADANDKADKAVARADAADKAMRDAQDDRARVEGDLARANGDNAEKDRQLAAQNGEIGNLRAEREALEKAGVPVAEIVGSAVPKIDAMVSATGPGFVVLSVGTDAGVKVGYGFDVYRGDAYVGRVVVKDVFPDRAVANVSIKTKGAEFKEQDSATTRL